MSAKEQKHSENKVSPKPHSPKPVTSSLETTNKQPVQPAAMFEVGGFQSSSLTAGNVLQLQRTVGNRAVGKALSGVLQMKGGTTGSHSATSVVRPPNRTGLPDNLKVGIEDLAGISLDEVTVNYNSSQPAQLQALAYTRGTEIHVAPGQEEHLPHEAWHVVQQAQGRVKPTMEMRNALTLNDDESLEREADIMGARAIQHVPLRPSLSPVFQSSASAHQTDRRMAMSPTTAPIQRFKLLKKFERGKRVLDARALVTILKEESDNYFKEIKGNDAQNPLLAAYMNKGERKINLGGLVLSISPNQYTNLADKGEANSLFKQGEGKVRGGGPSYVEFIAALIDWKKKEKLDDAVIAQRMFGVLQGNVDKEARIVLPTAVLAGAESMRNSKAYGSLLMFLDLVVKGKMNLEEGFGKISEDERSDKHQSLEETLAFLGIAKEKNPQMSKKALTDYLRDLDVDEDVKGRIAKYRIPNSWGGILPMTGKETAGMGAAPVPTKGSKTNLNLVQAKEASLLIQWLEAKFKEDPELDKSFSADPVNTVRGLIQTLLRSADSASAATPISQHEGSSHPIIEKLITPEIAESKSPQPEEPKEKASNISGEEGVDKLLVQSVQDFISERGYHPERHILVVDGDAWTCYIRCILHHFNAIGRYGEVMASIKGAGIATSQGVVIGSPNETQIKACIEAILGKEYYASVYDVAQQMTENSSTQNGEQVDMILTGVHFSLLL